MADYGPEFNSRGSRLPSAKLLALTQRIVEIEEDGWEAHIGMDPDEADYDVYANECAARARRLMGVAIRRSQVEDVSMSTVWDMVCLF